MTAILTTKPCPFCKVQHQVEVPLEGYAKFKDGAFVQDAFPHLTADERELLISGTCAGCWERYMRDED